MGRGGGSVEEWVEVTDKSTHYAHFHRPPPCIVKGALIKHPLNRPLCFSNRVDLGLPGLIPSLGDLGELRLNSTLHVNILQVRGKSTSWRAAKGGRKCVKLGSCCVLSTAFFFFFFKGIVPPSGWNQNGFPDGCCERKELLGSRKDTRGS